MAKITKHGGTTNKTEVVISPGNSSETLPEKQQTNTSAHEDSPPPSVRTMESRSKMPRTAGSTARSTAGDTRETGTARKPRPTKREDE